MGDGGTVTPGLAGPRGLLSRRVLLAGAIALALALLGSAIAFVELQRRAAAAASERVDHTLVVLQRGLEFDTALLRMEMAHRSFLVQADPAFLEARAAHGREAGDLLAQLRELTGDNPAQTRRLARIDQLLGERHARMDETAAAVGREGLDAARALLRWHGDGSILPLRTELDALRDEERRLLAERNELARAGAARMRWAAFLAPALGLLMLLAAARALLAQLARGERLGRELARANAMQRAMLDGAGYIIVATDRRGVITLFNRAATAALGWRPEEVVGRETPALFHDAGEVEARAAALAADLRRPVAGFEAFTAPLPEAPGPDATDVPHSDEREWTYVRRDGSRFPVQLAVSALRGEDGRVLGYIGMAQDIAARRARDREVRELNQQLQATVQELESFSYSVSHDLRAPLRHIDGYARMLAEDVGDSLEPEPRRFLQAIGHSSRRMGQLIDDLLALSRLGRKPLETRPVAMDDLAREAWADVFADGVPEAALRLGPLPVVPGDPALLRQVWLNLLGNAAKYSRDRGDERRIDVSAATAAGAVRFTVADNGVGFDPRYADKLFGVFQRLHAQDQFEGTGVGLAIVHRIVVRHGGRVWADAEPGAGARFHFELPLPEDA